MSGPPPLSATWQQADDLRARGAFAAARDLLEPAADVAAIRLGPDDRAVVETQRRLATVHRELGELAQARRVLEEALDGGLLGLGETDPLILGISAELGAIADELGNKHEARRNLARVARFGPAMLGADHPYVRTAQHYLGVDAPLPAAPAAAPSAAPSGARLPPTQPTPPTPLAGIQLPPPAPPARPGVDPLAPAPPWEPVEPGVYRSGETRRAPVQPSSAPAQPAQPYPDQPYPAQPYPDQPELVPPYPVPPSTALVPAPPLTPGLPVGPVPAQAMTVEGMQLESRPIGAVAGLPARQDWAGPHRGWEGPAAPVPAGPSRRGWWIALGAVLAAALLAGIAVTAFALARGPSAGSATGAASPSAAAAAPKDLKLRDDTVSVTLTWTDPSPGSVPFLIAGGRVGEQLRAFQSLPAGQTAYTVNGLNPTLDYCFTVVATYSTTLVATSDPVCTDRRHQPTASPSR